VLKPAGPVFSFASAASTVSVCHTGMAAEIGATGVTLLFFDIGQSSFLIPFNDELL
jgi:hypothetical protein